MGTHADVIFSHNGKDIVRVFHHFDGYVDGVGHELAAWLLTKRIGNGIPMSESYRLDGGYSNGAYDLAAQYVEFVKREVGGVYLYPLDESSKYVDYIYHVNVSSMVDDQLKIYDANEVIEISITNFDDPKVIFKGSPKELLEFKETEN